MAPWCCRKRASLVIFSSYPALDRKFDLVPSAFCDSLVHFQSVNVDGKFPMNSRLKIQQGIRLPLAVDHSGFVRAADTNNHVDNNLKNDAR